MSLSANSCSFYWYVSFEYLGSHGVGVRQMGQSGDLVIVRCPFDLHQGAPIFGLEGAPDAFEPLQPFTVPAAT